MYDPKAFFDRKGPVWDQMAHDPERIRTMLLVSDIKPHSTILDVGCGTGILVPYLMEYEPSFIFGVDYSPGMIREAQRKHRHKSVQFVCADIADITDITCDNCFLYNTLLHLSDPRPILAHIATLIAPGGRLTISHAQGVRHSSEHHHYFPPAHNLIRLLPDEFRADAVVDNNALLLLSAVKQ